MAIKIFSAALFGVEAEIVEVEASSGGGDFGHITIVGLPDASVSEAKERVRSSFLNGNFQFPKRKITVNLAPAHLKKTGPAYDLPIAISILALKYRFKFDFSNSFFAGELSLNGEVRTIKGIIPMALKAKSRGLLNLFIPLANAQELSIIPDLTIFPITNLSQLINHINHKILIKEYQKSYTPKEEPEAPDFADIKGQEFAKRGLEIAIAGGHNIILSGPPGSGKTLLARATLGILPPPSLYAQIEIAKVYSAAGYSTQIIQRPFRSPHHSASMAALIGGGSKFKPGEISLAHLGVLFLDEFPEFSRDAIESLRQPLEEGNIFISRASGSMVLPARFILIAAMNSCPCGLRGLKGKTCSCTPQAINKYRHKISGPIMDRIDLHLEIFSLALSQLNNTNYSENSLTIRNRIIKARTIQARRLKSYSIPLNTCLQAKDIKTYCALDKEGEDLILSASKRLNFSNRSYFKILKIARTIADLEGSICINRKHVAEALQYRPKIE